MGATRLPGRNDLEETTETCGCVAKAGPDANTKGDAESADASAMDTALNACPAGVVTVFTGACLPCPILFSFTNLVIG